MSTVNYWSGQRVAYNGRYLRSVGNRVTNVRKTTTDDKRLKDEYMFFCPHFANTYRYMQFFPVRRSPLKT